MRDGTDAAFDRLAELIASSPHNLVSRGERGRVRSVHIPEAAAVGALLGPAVGSRWLDLGTGGGLPGLVLALLFPEVEWTLLDATGKKVEAVRGFIEVLGLGNARAVKGRAEELALQPAYGGRYDGVVSRAVARLPQLMTLARGFLRDGGVLAAITGPRVDEEMDEAERVRRQLGFQGIHRQRVPAAVRPTVLVTMLVQAQLPRRHPKRSVVPSAVPRGRRPR
jgi:16S rRNA (guanine527-N7)-methyltransferase